MDIGCSEPSRLKLSPRPAPQGAPRRCQNGTGRRAPDKPAGRSIREAQDFATNFATVPHHNLSQAITPRPNDRRRQRDRNPRAILWTLRVWRRFGMARLEGIEPPTHGLEARQVFARFPLVAGPKVHSRIRTAWSVRSVSISLVGAFAWPGVAVPREMAGARLRQGRALRREARPKAPEEAPEGSGHPVP